MRIKRRRDTLFWLLLFFESLALYVRVGLDLSYAWEKLCADLSNVVPEAFLHSLRKPGDQPLADHLKRLGQEWPFQPDRIWFELLHQLYREGSALGPSLRRIGAQLQKTEELERERWARRLPFFLNLLLLIFFLPPAFLLLLAPLLWTLSRTLVD